MRIFNFLFFILFISSTAVANVFQRFTLLESTDLSGISRIKTGDFEEDGGDDLIQLVGNGYAAYIADNFNAASQTALYSSGIPLSDELYYPTGADMFVYDIDQNGKKDIILSRPTENQFVRLMNNGLGSFTTIAETNVNYAGARGISVGDITNDGWADVIYASRTQDAVFMLESNGDGTLQSGGNSQVIANITGAYSMCTADFDKDGDDDILVGRKGGLSLVRTDFSNPAGLTAFSAIEACSTGCFDGNPQKSLRVFDVDNDGDDDIVGADRNGMLAWWENLGDGTFDGTRNTITTSFSSVRCLEVVDINLDGWGDMILFDRVTGTIIFQADNIFTIHIIYHFSLLFLNQVF